MAKKKFERKDLPGAIAQFSNAIEREPQFAEAWLNRGVARRLIGQLSGDTPRPMGSRATSFFP